MIYWMSCSTAGSPCSLFSCSLLRSAGTTHSSIMFSPPLFCRHSLHCPTNKEPAQRIKNMFYLLSGPTHRVASQQAIGSKASSGATLCIPLAFSAKSMRLLCNTVTAYCILSAVYLPYDSLPSVPQPSLRRPPVQQLRIIDFLSSC